MIDTTISLNTILTAVIVILGMAVTFGRMQSATGDVSDRLRRKGELIDDLGNRLSGVERSTAVIGEQVKTLDNHMKDLTRILELVARQDERMTDHERRIAELERRAFQS